VEPHETQYTERQRQVVLLMQAAQERLCSSFGQYEERAATAARRSPAAFAPSSWERPGGGGGTARVLTDGALFERAGVNVSVVTGAETPAGMARDRPAAAGQPFFATGVSLVLHPRNPYVPTFHANFRYFDVQADWWFGGGMDLTPMYGVVADAVHFHRTLRDYCGRHGWIDYQTAKRACDDYFYIKHRQEMRGIGGIFFDYLHPPDDTPQHWAQILACIEDGISAIEAAYLPIVERHMDRAYGERERGWQLYRRGRYVEFNLVYDRGTVFGLQTNGDIEAILMSLPPLARWEFRYQPAPDSPEAATVALLQPRAWADTDT
jgi:coproporphyrinogen III oxidase